MGQPACADLKKRARYCAYVHSVRLPVPAALQTVQDMVRQHLVHASTQRCSFGSFGENRDPRYSPVHHQLCLLRSNFTAHPGVAPDALAILAPSPAGRAELKRKGHGTQVRTSFKKPVQSGPCHLSSDVWLL